MGCQMRQKAMRHNSIIYFPLLFIYQTPLCVSDSYLYISDSYLYIRLLFIGKYGSTSYIGMDRKKNGGQ